jgi:hypothetical protein
LREKPHQPTVQANFDAGSLAPRQPKLKLGLDPRRPPARPLYLKKID